MMKATYSEGFKEQTLKKVFQRDQRSIRAVAQELNVNYHTLKGWMKETVAKDTLGGAKQEKRPEDWTLPERLTALQESHGLVGEALNRWCRERGLFAHQRVAWQTAFCAGAGDQRASLRALQAENQRLSRELARKEKALAEAAALLVLQKKFQALLGEGSHDRPRRASTGGGPGAGGGGRRCAAGASLRGPGVERAHATTLAGRRDGRSGSTPVAAVRTTA